MSLLGRSLLLRPIRLEDEPGLRTLIAQCEPGDLHFRFFCAIGQLPHCKLGRYTQIDYDREMAFVAVNSENELLGEVRTVTDPDNRNAEFAILVRSEIQGKGLGHAPLEKMIRYCRSRGTGTLFGDVLASNSRMLELGRSLQFRQCGPAEGGIVRISLKP